MNYTENIENVQEYKSELIRLMIDSEVLLFGEFITKSGRRSPYFINTGRYRTGAQLSQLGSLYAACIMDHLKSGRLDEKTNVLFGPAYKGIPLVAATAMALHQEYGKDWNYCFNRKEAKDHGEGGYLVGYSMQPGDRILIIEDVVTAGTAVRESLSLIKTVADVTIAGLVVSVDRMERGQNGRTAVQELFEEFGIPTFSIVTVKEMLPYLNTDQGRRIREYLNRYCGE